MAQMGTVEGAELPEPPNAGPDAAVSLEQQRFWSELGTALGFGATQQPRRADSGSDEEGSSFYSGNSSTESQDDSGSETNTRQSQARPAVVAGVCCTACPAVSTGSAPALHLTAGPYPSFDSSIAAPSSIV